MLRSPWIPVLLAGVLALAGMMTVGCDRSQPEDGNAAPPPPTADAEPDGAGMPAEPNSSDTATDRTVAEAVRQHPQLETLETALMQTNMMDQLAGPGPVTLLAPTDKAFDQLGHATVGSLMLPRNEAQLTEILRHHVVAGWFSVEDSRDQNATQGDLGTLGTLPVQVRVSEDSVTFDGHARLVEGGIRCSNGMLHVIDAVLMPTKVTPEAAPSAGPSE